VVKIFRYPVRAWIIGDFSHWHGVKKKVHVWCYTAHRVRPFAHGPSC
jgi:hypothetical protein